MCVCRLYLVMYNEFLYDFCDVEKRFPLEMTTLFILEFLFDLQAM